MKRTFADIDAEIIARTNVVALYEQHTDIKITGRQKEDGRIECKSLAYPDQKTPSAMINAKTGRYVDMKSGENLSPWDAISKYGRESKPWEEVRNDLARDLNISLPGKHRKNDPSSKIKRDEHLSRDVTKWIAQEKPGTTAEAILLAGGFTGRWPCTFKDGERRIGKYRVLAIPVYGAKFTKHPPQAFVIFNLDDKTLPTWQDGKPSDPVRMYSVGPTTGGMMGEHAIRLLEQRSASIKLVIKAAGPTDMLAIQAAIPADKRDSILVVANASGETGQVTAYQAELLRPYPVFIVNDGDIAGCKGDDRWLWALRKVCPLVVAAHLPYSIQAKHGYDSRDFLNGTTWGKECLPVANPKGMDRDGKPPDTERHQVHESQVQEKPNFTPV